LLRVELIALSALALGLLVLASTIRLEFRKDNQVWVVFDWWEFLNYIFLNFLFSVSWSINLGALQSDSMDILWKVKEI
jgi:hypothetical protein